MPNPPRTVAFILAATDHGTLIVNRFDGHVVERRGIGVGFQLLGAASYDTTEVGILLKMLELRRLIHGDGVVAIDCGANIGVQTIEWAKHMTGWGTVLAFEAQERLYYALAGNIAINNCFNASAVHAAVTSQSGTMKMPVPNYLVPGSFGSLELRPRENAQFIGQPIDYSENKMVDVRAIGLDAIDFPRLDLIKLDVEGMELEALAGSVRCIERHHPVLFVEKTKTDQAKLRAWLDSTGYATFDIESNILALHKTDQCLEKVKLVQ
jgi:FkbM family methyltransferase